MLKCSLSKINALFEEIAKSASLYLPVEQSDGSSAYKNGQRVPFGVRRSTPFAVLRISSSLRPRTL